MVQDDHDRPRNERGRYTPEYPQSAFLDAIEEHGRATTSEVADHVGCSEKAAYRRLRAMVENDTIDNVRVGNALLWTINDT